MFRTSYLHHQENYNVLCWLTLHYCITMHGTKNIITVVCSQRWGAQ